MKIFPALGKSHGWYIGRTRFQLRCDTADTNNAISRSEAGRRTQRAGGEGSIFLPREW